MINILQRFLAAIAGIGVETGDSPELRLKKALLSVSVSVYGPIFIVVMGPLYFQFEEPIAALLYFGFGIFSLIGLAWFAIRPRIFPVYLFLVLSLGFVAELAGTIALGGFMNSSGLPMWGLLSVLGALIQYGPRPSLYWFAAYLANLILSVVLHPWLRPSNSLPHGLVLVLFVLNLILVSGFAFLSLQRFIAQRDRAFALFREEQQKSENLLLNILPREIAEKLKQRSGTIAEHYNEASILFADAVDFTSLSSRMSPSQLVELLNEVFSHFDMLAEKHGLEKIKTIGDCYMVAAGVPRHRSDHAQTLVRMALEMQVYLRKADLPFRMGVNSGPVVAGVIGRKKFIYDLWGDAVNTASRMESHGVPGAIH
ncbi:MAG TPA: adenylate/guanylate cyclase domain-containing protein, partial [Fibrobacteres bacterium]|nr:adenylate/guanylate cyclase domain-containing protein [Fibrobacterota bacterium]